MDIGWFCTLLPTNTKINHGCLNFMDAKFKVYGTAAGCKNILHFHQIIVFNQSRMLHVYRTEYLSALGGENYVKCQYLCVDIGWFCTLLPTNTKINHGCLNFMDAKFKVYGTAAGCKNILHFHQIIGTTS